MPFDYCLRYLDRWHQISFRIPTLTGHSFHTVLNVNFVPHFSSTSSQYLLVCGSSLVPSNQTAVRVKAVSDYEASLDFCITCNRSVSARLPPQATTCPSSTTWTRYQPIKTRLSTRRGCSRGTASPQCLKSTSNSRKRAKRASRGPWSTTETTSPCTKLSPSNVL